MHGLDTVVTYGSLQFLHRSPCSSEATQVSRCAYRARTVREGTPLVSCVGSVLEYSRGACTLM